MSLLEVFRKQLTTTESNESRYMTTIRWVVEAENGMLKQKYRFPDHKLDNKILPKVGSFFRFRPFVHN